jgi:intracellular sulfur oxidation DsrE/DsrF family protein
MSKAKILLQLDPDPHASVFDAVVAIDAGVDHLLARDQVEPADVRDLVYGVMFTRGPEELHNTAIFVGGSNVAEGEAILEQVKKTFFGPMRVSVLFDANGANTTAAAAVLAAARHVPLADAEAAVLAATGPVGQRVVRLLAQQGATVRVCSRSREKAQSVCDAIAARAPNASLEAMGTASPAETAKAIDGAQIVVAAGAAGVELLSEEQRRQCASVRVMIDLNAVPPLGIGGVKVGDKAKERDGQICYGAIGVGGTKMKIHKAALRKLFESNDQVLDAEEIFAIGQTLAP